MHVPELDSFLRKFHQLWKAGSSANLNLDCHAGIAWIGLQVQLGPAPGPANQAPPPTRYRGPSYQRRQGRRRAAKAAAVAAATASDPHITEEVMENEVDAEKADTQTENVVPDEEESAKKVNENEVNAEKVNITHMVPDVEQSVASAEKVNAFTCDICAFQSSWENGLKIHTGRKHKNIVQIDGCDDEMDTNDAYENSIRYWETGKLGMAYYTFLDVIEVIEKSELPEEDLLEEKAKVTEARKEAIGYNYKLYPPWK